MYCSPSLFVSEARLYIGVVRWSFERITLVLPFVYISRPLHLSLIHFDELVRGLAGTSVHQWTRFIR
jgi:hypothetical protein